MTETGTLRGSYAKSAGRRRDILEAGIEVFSTNGFRSGSIREIAKRVGMSQAGLLHHFANKNELLAGVLALRDERAQALVPDDDAPTLNTIIGFVELASVNSQTPGLVELHCVLSAEATSVEHPAHAYFVERYDWLRSHMTDAFRNAQANGELADGVSPESAASGLIAMSDGLQVQWLLDRSSLDMAEEMRKYLRPLLAVEL